MQKGIFFLNGRTGGADSQGLLDIKLYFGVNIVLSGYH